MNLPIIFRCEAKIFRSGGNSRLQESSDNLPIDGRNLPMINRQAIVRCMRRIVRTYASVHSSSKPSRPIIDRSAGIGILVDYWVSAPSIHRQSTDLPTLIHRSARHPTDCGSANNQPKIDRQSQAIDRSADYFTTANLPRNRKLILKPFGVIINSDACQRPGNRPIHARNRAIRPAPRHPDPGRHDALYGDNRMVIASSITSMSNNTTNISNS